MTGLVVVVTGAWKDPSAGSGIAMTSWAFRSVFPWFPVVLTITAVLFAYSTMISWSYYGEQGIHYLLGPRGVLPYKLLYCALIIVAAIPQLVATDAELDALTSLGTGVMLWANIPIMLLFGYQAMRAYHEYMGKLKAGKFHPHAAPPLKARYRVVASNDAQGFAEAVATHGLV